MNLQHPITTILIALILIVTTSNALPPSTPTQPSLSPRSSPFHPIPNYDSDYWLTVMAFGGPGCNIDNLKRGSSLFHQPLNNQRPDNRYITGTCYPVTDIVGSFTLLEGSKCTASLWSGSDCQGWNWRKTPGIPCIDLTYASYRVWCWDGPLYGPCGGKPEIDCQAKRDDGMNYTVGT